MRNIETSRADRTGDLEISAMQARERQEGSTECNVFQRCKICKFIESVLGCATSHSSSLPVCPGEDRELALQRRARSAKRSPDQPDLVERGRLRAKKLGELAARDAEQEIDAALELCQCGYQELWHEGPVSFHAPRVPQRRNSRRLSISRSPLEAMPPAHMRSWATEASSENPALICAATRPCSCMGEASWDPPGACAWGLGYMTM